jgi:hypothetical protein
MDKLIIAGGPRLEGEVRISGAKNATLPIPRVGGMITSSPARVPLRRQLRTNGEPGDPAGRSMPVGRPIPSRRPQRCMTWRRSLACMPSV